MVEEFDFSFCPKCGGTLEKKDNTVLVCSRCDLHYYVNPKPSNTVMLQNINGEILFVKRKYEPQKGYWDLPGGFVDLHETVEESVHREIQEELGITISDISYLTSFPDRYAYKGVNWHTICSAFTAKIPTNTSIKAADDVSEVAFFTYEDIPYDHIAFEGIKKFLMSIKKNSELF